MLKYVNSVTSLTPADNAAPAPEPLPLDARAFLLRLPLDDDDDEVAASLRLAVVVTAVGVGTLLRSRENSSCRSLTEVQWKLSGALSYKTVALTNSATSQTNVDNYRKCGTNYTTRAALKSHTTDDRHLCRENAVADYTATRAALKATQELCIT